MAPPQDDWHSWQVPGVVSETACAAAACDARVAVHSWNGTHCWVGDAADISYGTAVCANFTTGVRDPTAWPPALLPEAAHVFDDAAWAVVDLPHDAAADTPHRFPGPGGQGFRAPVATFYRKHFRLDAAWATGAALTIWLPGAAAASAWWLNGVPLAPRTDAGYLPLVLRIDDAVRFNLSFGLGPADTANVLAGWTDGLWRTGWWEEGQGLTRGGAALLVAAAVGSIAPSGVAAPSFVDGEVHTRAAPADGLWADAARVSPAADILLPADGGGGAEVAVSWVLFDAAGAAVGAANASVHLPAGGGTVAAAPGSLLVPAAELWSIARPALYTLQTALRVDGAAADSRNDSVGLRDVAWSGPAGLALNGQRVKLRGFCEHASWGGVGAAVPPRADLLRLQQLRGVGGNALRTSHNPPAPALLGLADRLGVAVLDESRVLATMDNVRGGAECGPGDGNAGGAECGPGDGNAGGAECGPGDGNAGGAECGPGGCRALPVYAGDIAADAAALARRDRLHASVLFYSLCNELGCGAGSLLAGDAVLAVKQALVAADGSRAVTGNMGWQTANATRAGTPMATLLDVFGMSHQSSATLEAFHAASPFKPLVMSECCSCETQRGADADLPRNASVVYYTSEASACLAAQTQVSNAPDYCAGTFVWTLHDYGGEPDAWPHVSSSFGAIDFAGFAKPAAGWFRAWWLAATPATDPSRPPLLPAAATAVSIVESWAPSPNGTRTVHVYANAPLVRLRVNGAVVAGGPVAVSGFGAAAAFYDVPYAPGVLLAEALTADGATVLATDRAVSWGPPTALVLTLDAPSVATGTGSALYLDGTDVAMVRATVVDAAGNAVGDAAVEVTFAVAAGPARVVGTHSGDPALQAPAAAAACVTYHGLARAIVRVTLAAAGGAAERALLAAVNPDAGAPGSGSSAVHQGDAPPPAEAVVTATAPGLAAAAQVRIPLSVDPADAVLAVAARSVRAADLGGHGGATGAGPGQQAEPAPAARG